MIDKLEMLIALSRERHFGRAAEACHVTQPTLSSAIKALEESLGTQLVLRGARFIGLTPEGERVLTRAKAIVAEARAMRSDLRVLSLTSREILERLADFEIDAGLSYAAADLSHEHPPGFQVLPLYDETYALVTQPAPDLPATMGWAQLDRFELSLLTPDMQNRRIIDRHLAQAGLSVTPRIESNSIVALISHAGEGHAATILPLRVATFFAQMRGLACIPLTGPEAVPTNVAFLLPPVGRRTLLLDGFVRSLPKVF